MAEWEAVARALVVERYNALLGYARVLAAPTLEPDSLVDIALAETIARPRLLASVETAEVHVRRAIASHVGRSLHKRVSQASGAEPEAGADPTSVEDEDDAYRPGAEARVQPIEHRNSLAFALTHLTPSERACVALRHVENLAPGEAAQVLGLSDEAVRRHVASGVAALNARLGTDEPTDDGSYVRVVGRDER